MRQLPRSVRALAAIALATAAGATAAAPAAANIPAPPNQWYGLPGLNAASGAQWMRAVAHSTPPTTVYAGLEGGGVFRSITGGATWSEFNSGFPNKLTTNVRALLTSGPSTVYAGTDSGVWKSTGGAWQPLAQGPEEDPAQPKKLNMSVQSLLAPTGGPMLAGVFNGGVYRSNDNGDTWLPPAANNGMPATETVYGLTSNIPGVIYATAGSGVYISTNQGASWTHMSDGIPGIASPHTTWAYPQKPQILFTATGSNGIYRSINGGLTWSPINDGLGAVRARGFQVFTGADGAHLYAATENGLWHALHTNSVIPPVAKPKWRKVTDQGLITQGSTNTIMWSLTAPVIPGAGAFGLIAGTQSNGGYFLPFSPPASACSTSNPTDTAICPQINGSEQVGQTLTATTGTWTGTETIDKELQWQLCTTADPSSCADIEGETESSLVIPETSQGDRYRVVVTATNPSPTFGLIKRRSVLTPPVAAAPSSMPGYNQVHSPSIDVLAPGDQFSPEVGDQVYADYGTTPNSNSDGWFNPKATSWSYEWLRCKQGGDDCVEIPGATSRTYTLKAADGTGTVRVRVKGTNSAGSAELTSSASYYVISQPASIAAPLLIDGASQSQAPSLSGTPYVGETLAGSVGGWADPTTDFERRWLQCDAGGASCTVIRKVASVEPETGSTYVLRPEDRGFTIRMRVKADVNGDLTPDGLDNFLPKAVEVDTPATAVVSDRPVPPVAGPGGGAGGGGGAADTSAPSLATPKLSKKSIVPGKAATISLFASEAGTMRVVITKPTTGRKVKGACKPQTKKNRKAKKCTYQKVITTFTRPASAGANAFKFDGKVGKKKLARGSYRMTIVVTDPAGNSSAPVVLAFKIVKK